MRWLLLIALLGCNSSEPKPSRSLEATAPAPTRPTTSEGTSTPKPPDGMDERMRHCPLALDGAESILEDIEGGVRFTIKAPQNEVAEARRRAHHIVEFAARKTREGHGGSDGKGGGRMKNCPVVTDDVTITATDVEHGAQLDIIAVGNVDGLRAATRERVKKFPFVGATIAAKP